ncbi:MAG TPA: RND family transporter, partial [Clostridiales bacterium]|nr:RND family transporter [Clostridiales bacterium]
MDRFRDGVIKHRKAILLGVLVVSIICAYLMTFVNIEYDLSSYLPKNAPTSRALLVLGDQQVPNLRTYIPNIIPREALAVKQQLSDIDGVQDVLWLDDMLDIQALPWEMIPESARAPYYQNGGAL